MASDPTARPGGDASSPTRSASSSGGAPLDRTERMAAVFGGGLLVHWGLRRGGLFGLLGAAAGGTLAWMGLNGRAPETGDGRWQVVSAKDYAARFGPPPGTGARDTMPAAPAGSPAAVRSSGSSAASGTGSSGASGSGSTAAGPAGSSAASGTGGSARPSDTASPGAGRPNRPSGA